MAEPGDVSIVIPAFNEADAITDVVGTLSGAARWREIIVVDDGSHDDTGNRAQQAGAIVVRHPYNKGNGAAVKTGIRRATAEYVLIIDADGQHQAADALRLVARLGEYDLVVGARSKETQATHARARVNHAAWGDAFGDLSAYVYCREVGDLAHHFHARMFAPELGIGEDPATGSAVAALGGVIAKFDQPPGGTHRRYVSALTD